MRFLKAGLPFILLVGLSVFCFFYQLGHLSYRIWDESRLITNAYEMSQTGSLIVTTFEDEPDMWNTKPPLMIWAQAIAIKFNGLNEFSGRLPAALCGVLTALVLFFFVGRFTGNYWAGLVSGVILCTAVGPIEYHGFRFGEYDGMLSLFAATAAIFLFLYTEVVEGKKARYMLLFFAALACACLTKGIAGLLFIPAYFIYIVIRGQLLQVLSKPNFYFGVLLFTVMVGGYYLLREQYNPGYLQAVLDNELGGRFLEVNEGHSAPFHFYFANLRFARFGGWFWIVPTGLLILLLPGNRARKRLLLFSFLVVATFLLVLSVSQTKLNWYDLPAYPMLGIIGALVFIRISEIVHANLPRVPKTAMIAVMLLIFTPMPFAEVYGVIRDEPDDKRYGNFYMASYCMRGDVFEMPRKYTFLHENYQAHLALYCLQMKKSGYNINRVELKHACRFNPGRIIFTNEYNVMQYVDSAYNTEVVKYHEGVKLYKVISSKQ